MWPSRIRLFEGPNLVMKGRAFQKFAQNFLLPELPGFAVKGDLIYRVTVGRVLNAITFDSSGFSPRVFYPNAFVQPLYVPLDFITMTLGKPFLGHWEFQPGNQALADRLLQSIKTEGMPLLQALGTPEKIAHHAEKMKSTENHYVRQATAYSMVLVGEEREAIKRLDELLVMLEKMASGIQKWALDVHREVAHFRGIVLRDPDEARTLLLQWGEETRTKLKLPE